MKRIPYNRPPVTGTEHAYISEALQQPQLSGDGPFCRRCEAWFEEKLGCVKAFLTPSCTHALEMAAMILEIGPGDEVIMPSYTFVSTANAFAMRGARLVFCDIRPDTMNLDERLLAAAITEKTRVIVPVHYAGVGCDMDAIMALAKDRGILVVEDAAQGIAARYDGRSLGSFGAISAFSFHETKNCTSGGEGGLLVLNDPALLEKAEIVREKGTSRARFFRGEVSKYTWMDLGSSYLPSELQAAYLWAQLQQLDVLTAYRLQLWNQYYEQLSPLSQRGCFQLPCIPERCEHNGHIFHIKLAEESERARLIQHLAAKGILAIFHYVPLHSAPAGLRFGRFHGVDQHTTRESSRILRLPLWHGLGSDTVSMIVKAVEEFFD